MPKDNDVVKILKSLNNLKVGVFIDNSNLFYAQKKAGWKIDYKNLRGFLSKYCEVLVYNFYTAVPKESDTSYKSTQKYLNSINKSVALRLKPLKYIREGNKIIKKGDVDLEIVIDVVRNIKKLDVIIVASGDSDYLELKNWVVKDNKKKIIFMGFENNTAWEIRQCLHLYLNKIRKEIEYKSK